MKEKLLYSFLIVLILPILGFTQVQAQTVDSACFTLSDTSGCAPLTVTAHDCSGDFLPIYTFEGVFSSDSTHTFTSPGIFPVIQSVHGNGGFLIHDTLYVEVLATPPPNFNIDFCENKIVNLEIIDTVYNEFIIDWGDGNKDTILGGTINHTYATATPFSITVNGLYMPDNCGNSKIVSITPINNINTPNIDILTVIADDSISLEYATQINVMYDIKQETNGSGTFSSQIINLADSTYSTTFINGLNTIDSLYCYQIEAFDRCGNNYISQEVCATTINAVAKNNQNDINWDAYTGNNFDAFELNKNGSLYPKAFPTNVNTLEVDTSIVCGAIYCYTLKTICNAGNSMSISQEACVTGITNTTPPAVYPISTYELDNSISVYWEAAENPIINYNIFTQKNGAGSWTALTSLPDTSYNLDPTADQECFKISYTDSCGLNSFESITTCPMVLSVKSSGFTQATLTWSDYIIFENGTAQYNLEVLNDQGIVVDNVQDISSGYAYDIPYNISAQNIFMSIVAIENGVHTSRSNSELWEINNIILIPNAFTPNGDGKNDTFRPKVRFIDTFRMDIYNNWGQMIFTSEDAVEGWDGTINGNNANAGVYTFTIYIADQNGKEKTQKGTLTLLR